MLFNKNQLINTYLNRNFFLFILCGGIGTLTNFFISIFMSNKVNPTLAYVIGYSISLFVSYYLNAKLIYKDNIIFSKFYKFVISYIPNFIILLSFVVIFLNFFHINKIVVYLLSSLFGLPITYIMVRVYAFGKRGNN